MPRVHPCVRAAWQALFPIVVDEIDDYLSSGLSRIRVSARNIPKSPCGESNKLDSKVHNSEGNEKKLTEPRFLVQASQDVYLGMSRLSEDIKLAASSGSMLDRLDLTSLFKGDVAAPRMRGEDCETMSADQGADRAQVASYGRGLVV